MSVEYIGALTVSKSTHGKQNQASNFKNGDNVRARYIKVNQWERKFIMGRIKRIYKATEPGRIYNMIITDEEHNYIIRDFTHVLFELSKEDIKAGSVVIMNNEYELVAVEYEDSLHALWVMDALKLAIENEDTCFIMPRTCTLNGLETNIFEGDQPKKGFDRFVQTFHDQMM